MKNYSINEIWNPGSMPNGHDTAVALIGAENVKILEMAGMQIESHFWDITRNALKAKANGVEFITDFYPEMQRMIELKRKNT